MSEYSSDKDFQDAGYKKSKHNKYNKYNKYSKTNKQEPVKYTDNLNPEEKIDYHNWDIVSAFVEMKEYCRNERVDLLDKCQSIDLFQLIEKNS